MILKLYQYNLTTPKPIFCVSGSVDFPCNIQKMWSYAKEVIYKDSSGIKLIWERDGNCWPFPEKALIPYGVYLNGKHV